MRCEAAPLHFRNREWRLQYLAKWNALFTTAIKKKTQARCVREAEKLGVTVEQLLLGKHIEPSGRHIYQYTECQSAAPAGSHPSLLHHATVTVVR